MTVRQIQNLLQFLGFYSAAVDGIWGGITRRGVEDFQRAFTGLAVTGEADGETQKALRHAVACGIPDQDTSDGETLSGSFWDQIEFFVREEFRCTCGGRGCSGFPVEPVERLVRNAEDVRKHFGRVAIVSSGVRCQLRNSELPGSAENSLHMLGKAMDFAVSGIGAQTLMAYVRTLPDVDECYAIDGSYVHMGVLEYS